MAVDLERLGQAAQAQVQKELARRKLQDAARTVQKQAQAAPKADGMESDAERRYYKAYIWPRMLRGEVAQCEMQKRFALLPKAEYCGLCLPAAHYTPDFVITYKNGGVEVVEVKSRFTRKQQRDYIYRRRLFIDLIARPQGWIFTEYITE